MALRDLLEGECGASNSLVRLTTHFVQDRGLKDENYRHPFQPNEPILSSQDTDQLVQQFLEETVGSSPQSFRMDSLLAEMRDIEVRSSQGPPVQSPSVSQLAVQGDSSCWADAEVRDEENVNSWAEQYIESGRHFMMPGESDDQYAIWKTDDEEETSGAKEVYELGFGPNWAQEYLETSEQDEPNEVDKSTVTPLQASDLATSEEYADESKDQNELQATANKILANVDDPQLTYSKFMKFMQQIGEGEITIESGEVIGKENLDGNLEEWANEFVEKQKPEQWAAEYGDLSAGASALPGGLEESEDDFTNRLWSKLSHQWEKLADNKDDSWTSEFEDYSAELKEYNFAEENPMVESDNALEEGIKKRALGDLPSAVLCFEAAVRQNEQTSQAWELLGVTQAEIEQDRQAIIALKKALSLDPKNLNALMTLAASYTNENYQNQACHALREWLHVNPKYTDLIQEKLETINVFRTQNISSRMIASFHDEVKAKYLEAARRNPSAGSIDADVQCGLGILFNLSGQLDKAADCFRAALQARPDDCKLWNRLGATLANDNKSEEAVDAYHNALQLSPGFIRARYNLGITCVHLRAYREAAEHLLSALNQQAAGRGIHGEKSVSMSDSIWSTMRLTVSLLQRSDLIPAVNQRDLKRLNEEFGIADIEGQP